MFARRQTSVSKSRTSHPPSLISIAAAFAAGCGATHLLIPALAAESSTAQIIHVPEMNGEALGLPSGTELRSRTFVSADGATVGVQEGNTPKHMHLNANEMQYILEETGTLWLGDKEVQVKPGDLVIIPKGMPHGGTKPDAQSGGRSWRVERGRKLPRALLLGERRCLRGEA
jgi:mannose-6-phosphate isomerase-like protein (cupin superfamily)